MHKAYVKHSVDLTLAPQQTEVFAKHLLKLCMHGNRNMGQLRPPERSCCHLVQARASFLSNFFKLREGNSAHNQPESEQIYLFVCFFVI